jgi:hypothetical protein
MAQDEWDWIVEHAHGGFDHLVIASSLPVFLPPGIHHLEAWNEAICDGAWGSLVQRIGERLRRAVDLEHWAAYQLSFRRLVDLLCSVSSRDSPASITILSGDVHTTYIADIDLGGGCGSSSVRQVVCSPFRNPLDGHERRVVKATGSRVAARIFARLARLAGVESIDVSWKLSTPRTFENSIGQLELEPCRATVTLFRTEPHPQLELRLAYSDEAREPSRVSRGWNVRRRDAQLALLERNFALALQIYADVGYDAMVAEVHMVAGEEFISEGLITEGETELAQALGFYRGVNANHYIDRCERFLLTIRPAISDA